MSSTSNMQLARMAKKISIPLKAILSKNELIQVKPQNGGYIINLQSTMDEAGNPLPGSHWVALYIEGKRVAYFDSFGVPPPLEVMKFIKPITRRMLVNVVHVQNLYSGYCGQYTLEFIEYMFENRKVPFEKRYGNFINIWDSNPENNLKLLKKYMLA